MNWKFWRRSDADKCAETEDIPPDAGLCLFSDLQYDPDYVWQLTAFEPFYLKKCNGEQVRANLCEKCGACCAFFCVSFPEAETDEASGGVVPIAMTLPTKDSKRFMKGTKTKTHRCIALEGMVGSKVRCGIYENRPSACRNFMRSWENDIGNRLCDKARGAFGLQPFSQY
ncbi:MAG: hypothetical protein B6245_16735 [Desulfobacteraceae bacterium 4572_88]|nr:MAG: hypothetical protein B6245_16735 [Desulfobacteraceae bacterium 4572_88]